MLQRALSKEGTSNEPEPKEGVDFPIQQSKKGLQDKCFLKTQLKLKLL